MVSLSRTFSSASSTLTYSAVLTGEEEEETLHQVRGKLFSLEDSQWKERGTGLLKLNVRQVDGTNARLGMFHLVQIFFSPFINGFGSDAKGRGLHSFA